MIRRIGAVILGFFVGFVTFVVVQGVIATKFPPETVFNAHDTEAMTAYFRSLPNTFFIYIVCAHAMSALISSFITAKMADKFKFYLGLLVGGMFVIAALTHILTIPTPGWVLIADPIAIVILVYCGAKLGSRK